MFDIPPLAEVPVLSVTDRKKLDQITNDNPAQPKLTQGSEWPLANKKIGVGMRNTTLTREVGSWIRYGMPFNVVLAKALELNSEFEHPLGEYEVRGIVNSISKAELKNHPEKAAQSVAPVISPLKKLHGLSATNRTDQLHKNLRNDNYVIPLMALEGQLTTFYAMPNTGKTLLFFHFIIIGIKSGTFIPKSIIYFNADDSYKGLCTKTDIAEQYGFYMVSPAESGIAPSEVIQILDELAGTDDANGVIIFLDTLKKFADMMSKKDQKHLYMVLRKLTAKNATVIIAGHANKHLDASGNLVYEGTSDTKNDIDCMYSIYQMADRNDGKKVVEFRNEKSRGDVAETVTYEYRKREGMSYMEIVDSVNIVDSDVAADISKKSATEALQQKYESEIIFVSDLIKDKGAMNQKAIMEEFSNGNYPTTGEFTRRDLQAALKKLTGIVWVAQRGDKNAKMYDLIELQKRRYEQASRGVD